MQERETVQEVNQKIDKLAQEVLTLSRNSILARMRFLDMALNQLEFMPIKTVKIATDGKYLLFNGRWILYAYHKEKEAIVRNYLHLTMHCIFRHMYVNSNMNRDYWNLACDITVEALISELALPAAQAERERWQSEIVKELKSHITPFTADKIYHYFLHNHLSASKLEQYEKLFRGDDHAYWYPAVIGATQGGEDGSKSEACDADGNATEGISSDQRERKTGKKPVTQNGEKKDYQHNGADRGYAELQQDANNQKTAEEHREKRREAERNQQEKKWQDIAERMQTDLETFGRLQGIKSGELIQALAMVNREKQDYGSFLKKFASRGEIMQLDDDEFDYIAYTYGLQLYQKMPLIEPLEYKEVKRIKEFVIAIDTSGSVAGNLVQKFVQKTYNILQSTESFFARINLHIIQCDEQIKEHVKITNRKEFDEYMEHMNLRGFGGTDFRPVFELVDDLIRQKEFENLKGLLYFTDGQGTFPNKKPKYATAFVFVEGNQTVPSVPSWAISLVLQDEDILDD